eukprot:snap_masked-scaffold_40-processed-gene-2.0-mRNA-1 protein AED:1.00 eAED:1.00 QI:0/-1/0/0/-1/1/1/0/255
MSDNNNTTNLSLPSVPVDLTSEQQIQIQESFLPLPIEPQSLPKPPELTDPVVKEKEEKPRRRKILSGPPKRKDTSKHRVGFKRVLGNERNQSQCNICGIIVQTTGGNTSGLALHRKKCNLNLPTPKKMKMYSSGSEYEELIGYSRAVSHGDYVFLSGCTGYYYRARPMSIAEAVEDQCRQCLVNIESALKEVDSSMSLKNIVEVMYILPDKRNFPKCWEILRKKMAHKPVATMIEAGLVDDKCKIEIKVTAARKV